MLHVDKRLYVKHVVNTLTGLVKTVELALGFARQVTSVAQCFAQQRGSVYAQRYIASYVAQQFYKIVVS